MRDIKHSARRLLIAGHYGFGNVGDEAILSSLLEHLQASIPGVRPVVVSGDPETTTRLHGVPSIHWTDIASILAQAEECDAILLGGGGLFHDYWNFDPSSLLTPDHSGIAYYAGFPVLGAILDIPTIIVSVGVGPLLTAAGKETTRLAFENAAHVSVRDTASKKVLEEIGVDGSGIVVTADAAFALARREVSLDAATAKALEALPRPIAGVALRSWDVQGSDPEELARAAAGALDRFIGKCGGSVLFFTFQRSENPAQDDAAFAESVRSAMRSAAASLVLSGVSDPIQIAALIARVDLMLAMRLHSVILALKAHTPFAAIAYDPKVRSVVEAAGCGDYMLDVAAAASGALYDRLAAAFAHRAFFAGAAAQRVATLGDLAEKTLAGMPAILEKPPKLRAATAAAKAVAGALAAASTRLVAAREEKERLVVRFGERQRTVEALASKLEAETARTQALVEQVAERQAEIERIATSAEGLAAHNRELERQVAEKNRQIAEIISERARSTRP